MSTNRRIDTLVGGFVLLGLAALLFLALKAGNLGSFTAGGTYATQAKFDNIGGLKVRAPSIAFDDQTYQAVVSLSLDQRFKFPKDSSAKILTSGLLGEQYIGLEAGGDDKMLAAGDTIRMTQSAIVLENLIGQFLFSKAAEGEKKP